MNAQENKYQMIKNQLLAMSFDWVTITTNGLERDQVYFNTGDEIYTLTIKGPLLTLTYGVDKEYTLGFISEFNTDESFIIKQCQDIDSKVRKIVV